MAEKNEIHTEVCRDHQENNAPMRWQKQVSNSTGYNPEIATRDNIHIQEKEVRSVSCINLAFNAAHSILVHLLDIRATNFEF
jgi:hypothetical protein